MRLFHRPCLIAAAFAASAVAPVQAGGVTRTFQVSAGGSTAWTIDGQSNPPLSLQRGGTYVFHLNNVGAIHPFNINTINAPGPNFLYNDGVTNNGATGTTDITFVVPADAPATLHYNCENHVGMNGPITITAPDPIFADGFENA
ncbi:hypothetical protein [Tahibacter caeni]|uniref:hypothetical protein n=1 Tax=Tahibacter caeni TaxID=1453545 RepID=UPI002147EE51|nr:hypothetical protein [Tahibacter caeni]